MDDGDGTGRISLLRSRTPSVTGQQVRSEGGFLRTRPALYKKVLSDFICFLNGMYIDGMFWTYERGGFEKLKEGGNWLNYTMSLEFDYDLMCFLLIFVYFFK